MCVCMCKGERERQTEGDLPDPVTWFLGTFTAELLKDSWTLNIKAEPWPEKVVAKLVWKSTYKGQRDQG